MSYTYQYPRPAVTVDAVVYHLEEEKLYLLLVQRKKDPFADHWALPGGFLEMDESPEAAVQRELKEETGLVIKDFFQIGTFGAPGRDPRHRTISIAYLSLVKDNMKEVKGADDAADARWYPVDELPDTLAFDHYEIIEKSKELLNIKLKIGQAQEDFGLNESEIEKVQKHVNS